MGWICSRLVGGVECSCLLEVAAQAATAAVPIAVVSERSIGYEAIMRLVSCSAPTPPSGSFDLNGATTPGRSRILLAMWKPDDVGEIIASRQITFTRANRKHAVEIAIGRPVKGPERRDPWWCPVRVSAPLGAFEAIGGVDSLQAMMLALEFLQTMLPTLARRKRGTVRWLAEHEQLIFADTIWKTMAWEAVENALDGLRRAIGYVERQHNAPKALLNDLRRIVARSGAGKRYR